MKKNLIFSTALIVFLGLANSVLAQIKLFNPLDPIDNFPDLITKIADYIAGIIGALAVLMFIWAGILYLTSGASPGNVQKANKAVLYAVIGLAIAIAGTGLIELVKKIIGG